MNTYGILVYVNNYVDNKKIKIKNKMKFSFGCPNKRNLIIFPKEMKYNIIYIYISSERPRA